MIIDISILEERVNTYTRLQEIAKCCLSGYEVERMFDFLYSAWELDSGDLWYLGYWNDYKDCGSIVLQVAKALGKELVEAQLLSEIGYVYMEWEEFEIAHTYFSQSIEKYKRIDQLQWSATELLQGKLIKINRPVGKQKQCIEVTSHLFLDFNPYLKKHSHRNKLKHNRASIAVMITPKQSKKRCSICY